MYLTVLKIRGDWSKAHISKIPHYSPLKKRAADQEARRRKHYETFVEGLTESDSGILMQMESAIIDWIMVSRAGDMLTVTDDPKVRPAIVLVLSDNDPVSTVLEKTEMYVTRPHNYDEYEEEDEEDEEGLFDIEDIDDEDEETDEPQPKPKKKR